MQMEAKNEALRLIARALNELECYEKSDDEMIRNAKQLLRDAVEKLAI